MVKFQWYLRKFPFFQLKINFLTNASYIIVIITQSLLSIETFLRNIRSRDFYFADSFRRRHPEKDYFFNSI